MKAYSNLIDLPVTEIVLLNLLYEYTAECTSIVIQDPQDNIFHARNLDFNFAPYLANLTFHARYFQNGKLLYEALTIAGYAGLITGVKPGAFSLSIDSYVVANNDTILDIALSWVLTLGEAAKGSFGPPYLARKAFETISDYDSLLKYLTETETLARVFFIIAGTEKGQGAVITKFRDSVENVSTIDVDAGKWYVAQTNFRRDIPDPTWDDRETAAT